MFCTETNCSIRASFGFTGQPRMKCSIHKLTGMVCLSANVCQEVGCTTASNYNHPTLKRAAYCGKHKKEGMINVTGKKCDSTGCLTSPSFNKPGEKRGIYCDTHKLEGMVNVESKRCLETGCLIAPSYGISGTTKSLYCVAHKKEEMVVVTKNKKCQLERCKTRASYGEEYGETTHCAKHRTITMVCKSGIICTFCDKRASYNFIGEAVPICCNSHKIKGMVNIKDPKCMGDGCMKIPSFNYSGKKKGLYCRVHKLDGMVNVREKTCKIPLCTTQVGNEKYEGYCLNCFMHLFPDKPVCRNYKTKEKAVRNFLAETYTGVAWTFDVRMAGGISLRRPDAVLDLSSHAIIIEVDENQHTSYDCTCDNKRLMELSADLKHKPLTFIRFNPDSYLDISGSRCKSCWKTDGNGILRVHKEEISEWETRLTVLKETIDYWIKNPTDKTINVIQLYFDCCS